MKNLHLGLFNIHGPATNSTRYDPYQLRIHINLIPRFLSSSSIMWGSSLAVDRPKKQLKNGALTVSSTLGRDTWSPQAGKKPWDLCRLIYPPPPSPRHTYTKKIPGKEWHQTDLRLGFDPLNHVDVTTMLLVVEIESSQIFHQASKPAMITSLNPSLDPSR